MSTGTLFEMQAQQTFGYPKPLVEEFRPVWIQDFVGLEKQKRVLTALVKAPRQCNLLLKGPSGTGKTSIAIATANEMLAQLWTIGAGDCKIEKLQEVIAHCNYIPKRGLNGFHFVLCDEIETASPAARAYLLSRMDSSNPVPNTIFCFTSNETELEEKFESRCIKLNFNSYNSADGIVALLSRIWKIKAPVTAEEPNLKKLACGNVRESLQRLEVALLSA
jgi:replication-associated recombination protein RarA